MALKSYLIAPEGGGLQTDYEPWLIAEDAFADIQDAYLWRGRVRKRFGLSFVGGDGATDLNTRLRIDLGDTDGNGDLSGTAPGSTFKVGQMFSIGTEIFTVNATGTPATLLDTGSATTATFNTTSGAFVFVGATPTTAVYFYPAEPVMGIRLRENTTYNFEETIAFDTQFAYGRTGGAWERVSATPATDGALFTSSNSQFVWTTNYRGNTPQSTWLYACNYKPLSSGADGIQTLPQGSSTWASLRPQLDSGATRFLEGCKILLPFKGRLLALNTLETGVTTFSNRVRWSQLGDPTTAATSWLDDTPGRGGSLDAPTKEAIITAQLLKDRLIVYFERQTFELVYTSDSQLPFRWQQINSELGAESTFSVIGFDQVALGVGNVGIHACDGVSVERIDNNIPDVVFQIHNGNSGVDRVYGIRDFYRELVYWTFPDAAPDPTFPTRVLVYDYAKKTWAFINDSITCFGYLQFDADMTWADVSTRYPTWADWDDPWNSAQVQSQFPWIVAGNQQGWTFLVDTDKPSNCQSLYITDLTATQITVINHNLMVNDYVRVEDAEGLTGFNGLIMPVIDVVDANTIEVEIPMGTVTTGTYTGNGKLTRISKLKIRSKQWNPGTPIGQQFRMPYLDLLLDTTSMGEISVDYYGDFNSDQPSNSGPALNVVLGSAVVSTQSERPLGENQGGSREWHRYFVAFQASTIQIEIYLSDAQLKDYAKATSDFQLNATQLFVEPGGRITG